MTCMGDSDEKDRKQVVLHQHTICIRNGRIGKEIEPGLTTYRFEFSTRG